MINVICRYIFIVALVVAAWAWSGETQTLFNGEVVASAEARRGRPATPVSYAGVARRSSVGAGAPGVGVTPGVGAGAPGVGATPGVGAGAPGVGAEPANRGGPVNRAGRR